MTNDSVKPFFGEVDEGFEGYAVKGDQGFVSFRVLGRVVVKEGLKIFNPVEGQSWIVWTIAGVSGGGDGGSGGHSMGGDSEDGERSREHGDQWCGDPTGKRSLSQGVGGGPASE